jgi:signal recognition particle receptor subunit beta
MVVVSYSGKEINGKLVYYGPGLSGKTTNLEYIYQSVPSSNRGKMVSMKTRTERTLFFDFLPVDLGEMGGFKTRFLLYTVPGQVYYNATRKLVLRGVDAVIFVADSERGKMDENIESLQNLRDNLTEYGLDLDKIPWVIQYNKRDLDDVYTIEELEQALNPAGVPYFEAVATTGPGVFETFRGIAKLLLQKLSKEIKLGESKGSESKIAPAPAPVKEEVGSAPEQVTSHRSSSREIPYRPGRPGASEKTPPARSAEPAPAASEPPAPEREEEPVAAGMPVEMDAPMSAEPERDAVAEPVQAAESVEEPVSAASAPEPEKPAEPEIPAAEVRPEAPARKLEPVLPEASADESDQDGGRGFWGKIFRRDRKDEEPAPTASYPRHARVSEVKIPAVAGSGETSPVFIEKRIQVPITLGPEEIVRGATLRLVLEIQVEASADKEEADGKRHRAA